jgi:hypothetical protein
MRMFELRSFGVGKGKCDDEQEMDSCCLGFHVDLFWI